jgi:hypothetical protein
MAINRLGPVALAAAVLMLGGALAAQASDDRQKTNRRTESAQPRQAAPRESAPPPQTAAPRERAVPRESAPPRETARAPREDSPRRTAEPRTASEARPVPARAGNTADAASNEDQAVPRGSRPRDGRATSGRAVVRQTPIRPRQTIIYYPRRDYPFGYGGFGLGYFYYDPYAWGPYSYPGYYGGGYGYPYGGYGGYGGYGRYAYGGIRLKVKPRDAEVYVDGYYVGRVDDFDGVFQRLELAAGPHRIEIREPGRPPLAFDVRIPPGETITYRGDLNKLR